MATKMVNQRVFTFGEVDQTVWKRTDVPEYLTAAQSLLNMEVGTTGLAKKRPGTSLLYNVTSLAQQNSRMYEFLDQNGNYYVVLSAGNGSWYVFESPNNETNVINYQGDLVITNTGAQVVVNVENLTFVQTITGMPYGITDLPEIDYTTDGDSLILTHPSYAPGRIYISSYNGDAFPTFAFQYLNIYPLPSYDFNKINYNSYGVTISVTSNTLTFTLTGVGANPGFTSAWIGGTIVGGGATVTEPVGYAIITNVVYASGGGGTVTFTATVQLPFLTSGYAAFGSQYSIAQPAWSASLGYPAKVMFFQNRLWLANTPALPNTIFGSRINQPISFDIGTGADTDAIVYTIGQTDAGSIVWLNSGKQLEIYCENDEFACPQNENSALTPSTFAVRQQSSYGASGFLKPITYINDSYYTTKSGKAFVNFHFTGVGLTYTATNVSAASSHLIKQPINRALLRGTDSSQDNFVYLLNPSDDTITAFQFATEYKLAAFTPIVFQPNVELIDIVTIDNTIYILKYYTLTQSYTIEAFDETTRIDCNFNASMQSSGLVTGLNLLNGYTVQVVYDNQDFGQYVVQNNQITVYNPSGIVDTVMIGLLYNVACVPMYPFASAGASAFKKQVTRIYVDYYNSINFQVNGYQVPYQYFPLTSGAPLVPQTETAIVAPFYGWNRFNADGAPIISITQSSPFDLQITSIGYQVDAAVL
jgi:hypothetical protein